MFEVVESRFLAFFNKLINNKRTNKNLPRYERSNVQKDKAGLSNIFRVLRHEHGL